MDKRVNISTSELKELIIANSIITANKILTQTGLIKEVISFAEIKKLYGRSIAEEAYKAPNTEINWFIRSRKGQGVAKYCQMSEFQRWLIRTDRIKVLIDTEKNAF